PLPNAVSLAAFEKCIADPHPRVRLEAVHGLSRLGTAAAGLLALDALRQPLDRFLEFSLAETVSGLADPLMAAIEGDQWSPDSPLRQRQLEFVLTAIDPARASQFLGQRLAQRPLPRDGGGPWIELLGQAGDARDLQRLYDQAIDGSLDVSATVRALDALHSAARLRKVRPSRIGPQLASLLAHEQPAVQLAATRLAGSWQRSELVAALAQLATDSQNSPPLRSAAVQSLAAVATAPAIDALAVLAGTAQENAELRSQAVTALAPLNIELATAPFYDLLSSLQDEQTALELWRRMLGSERSGPALAEAFPADGISQVAARAGVRAAREGDREQSQLLAILLPLSGLTLTAEQLTPQRMQQLAQQAARQGDAVRGEEVYRRQELACGTCHAIGGVGGRVGPDLTSLGASAPLDYIIDSLFNPDAKIKEGFHSVVVATADGQVLNGVEVRSDAQQLVLRDVSNRLVEIPLGDIIAKKAGKSLMPSGVVDRLTPTEQIDLIHFLSQLGKPGNYDASRGGVARVFDVLAGTHRIEQDAVEQVIHDKWESGWSRQPTRVNGELTRTALTEAIEQRLHLALVHIYARTRFELAQAGEASFTVTANTPLALWIDGQPLAKSVQGEVTTFRGQLSAGSHRLLLRLDARELPERFRLECPDASFANEL
ncbi:MAG: HEAT repeat domain-containing protein, partial [Planctomycetales bacterium]|nr:HEAT repeat domain-containing protein [Planctomycetales bacterium]